MSKKIKTVFLFLILILICGFFVWQHYQKIENKYNACIEKCRLGKDGLMALRDLKSGKWTSYQFCIEDCKEEYGK